MTLPIRDDDDLTPPGSADGSDRPDWLVDTNEGLGQVPPRTGPAPAAPPPRLAEQAPRQQAPEASARIDGLVGPEVPAVLPPPVLGERNEQLGVDPRSLTASAVARFHSGAAPARPVVALPAPLFPVGSSSSPVAEAPATARAASTPPATPTELPTPEGQRDFPQAPVAASAWSAAASSIPSLRSTRRRAIPVDELAPDAEWDEAKFTAPDAPVRTRNPVVRRPRDPFAAVLRFAARVPKPVLAIVAGVLVAVAITMAFMWPREHFTSVRHIKVHARDLDGQLVHVRGTVGQSFPVGGGFAFYLHQSRDTIVVFTRNRTPVERKRIKLIGTVSTGFLDGAARAAIFEDPTPRN